MFRYLIVLMLIILLPLSALAEIKTITHTVKQVFGGSQSPDDARIAAVAKAKLEAMEMAGTYIESTTVVKNSSVASDEIIALSSSILKAEVISQKNYLMGDAFGMEITVKIEVDTSVLDDRIKKMLDDRVYMEKLTAALNHEKVLLQKIADLEKDNIVLKGSAKESAGLEKKFKKASQDLQALANLEYALSVKSSAFRDYTRTTDLHAKGLVTRSQLQESKARYDTAVESLNYSETVVKAGIATP